MLFQIVTRYMNGGIGNYVTRWYWNGYRLTNKLHVPSSIRFHGYKFSAGCWCQRQLLMGWTKRSCFRIKAGQYAAMVWYSCVSKYTGYTNARKLTESAWHWKRGSLGLLIISSTDHVDLQQGKLLSDTKQAHYHHCWNWLSYRTLYPTFVISNALIANLH